MGINNPMVFTNKKKKREKETKCVSFRLDKKKQKITGCDPVSIGDAYVETNDRDS